MAATSTINYDEDALDALCSKIDLLEYASESMDFEKRGSDSYAAHCPRHIDKTPSLVISPSKNLFHCFSCGCGGNLINWLMTFEHMNFESAVKKLGDLTGVDVGNFKQCSALKIYKDIERANNTPLETYVERPILDPCEIEKYDDEVPHEWVAEGIDPEVMKKYNIRIDNNANRIVYPVYDQDFNLIGFKGRTRFPNYDAMKIKKYLNYQKIGTTNFFVGMKENYENIKRQNEVIIFEGIKSVMKVESWGYDYCVASETGWLNDDQVFILIKLGIKNVVIAYDNDVPIRKILDCTVTLRRFTNVYIVMDRRYSRDKLLTEPKLAPCDKGREVWEILYREKRKLQ